MLEKGPYEAVSGGIQIEPPSECIGSSGAAK